MATYGILEHAPLVHKVSAVYAAGKQSQTPAKLTLRESFYLVNIVLRLQFPVVPASILSHYRGPHRLRRPRRGRSARRQAHHHTQGV